jgi:transcriptional regulator with XRE-family HTH domain
MNSSFPERLRVLRLTAGLSQLELAARAGVSGTLVSRYERGRRRPRAAKRATLAAVLGPGLLPPPP